MVQCKKCSKFISMAKDEIVKCMGPCEGIFHKKCVTKKTLKNEKCEDCITPFSSPSIVEPNIASTLADMNRKMEVIYNMEKKLADLTDLVDFVSGKYDKICEYQLSAEKKIKALENKNAFLEKCNKSLEERLNDLEEKERERKVELVGVEKKGNEVLSVVIAQVAQKLELDPNQIESAVRVGRDKANSEPQPIVVTLRTKEARDKWIEGRKKRLTNGDLHGTKNDKRIYVNENLTRHKRYLLWAVKTQFKNTYKYIWVQDGKILIRKSDEQNKILSIRSERDLDRLVENNIKTASNSKD